MKLLKLANFNNIYEVDCFREEFLNTVDEEETKEPPFPRYQKWLYRSLYQLHEKGLAVLQLRDFEKLHNSDYNIYAIRYPKSKLNTRVIFYCHAGNAYILLAAFNEKSSSDYQPAINLAVSRLKLLGVESKKQSDTEKSKIRNINGKNRKK